MFLFFCLVNTISASFHQTFVSENCLNFPSLRTNMCIFEFQTSIWLTESQCRKKPKIKTVSTEFTMCYYVWTESEETRIEYPKIWSYGKLVTIQLRLMHINWNSKIELKKRIQNQADVHKYLNGFIFLEPKNKTKLEPKTKYPKYGLYMYKY